MASIMKGIFSMQTRLFVAGWCLLTVMFLSSCASDSNDDLPQPQPPTPSGLVLLDTEYHVVKGDTFKVRFRINPSGIDLKQEDLKLDFTESQTYTPYTPESGEALPTKISYVTPSDFYACTALEPDKNAAGDTLDGQWVLTIRTQGEDNFMNLSTIHLVMQYTDATGATRLITSSNAIEAQIYPRIDEGILIGYSKGQTYRGASKDSVLPYPVLLDVQCYKNEADEYWWYNRELITEMEFTVDTASQNLFTITPSADTSFVFFTPTSDPSWEAFEIGSESALSTPARIKLVDTSGYALEQQFNLTYYKANITAPITLSANEVKESSVLYEKLSEWFDQVGITADFNSGLLRTTQSKSSHSTSISKVGVRLSLETSGGDGNDPFDAELKINNLGVKKGESPDNVFRLKIITTPYSSNNDNYQSLILYDVAVTVALTVTD